MPSKVQTTHTCDKCSKTVIENGDTTKKLPDGWIRIALRFEDEVVIDWSGELCETCSDTLLRQLHAKNRLGGDNTSAVQTVQ